MVPVCPHCHKQIVTLGSPRTARQAEVLEFIVGFEERHGRAPSFRQVAIRIGVNSKATIAKHIKALQRQGFLKVAA